MIDEKELPEGWSIKKLGDVCDTTSGGTPSRKESDYYNGNIPWIKSGELDKGLIIDSEEKITAEAIKNSSAKIFPKGTLLIALYGATIGKLAFLGVDAATNQAICGIFKNDRINQKYLYNYLFSKRSHLIKQGIGGAQPNISQTILKNLEIPLPPLKEQHQIVEKIEELFSELDNGIENLKTAQQQLKVYRQAVLKWAFGGDLTDNSVNDEGLPIEWKLAKIKDVAITIGGYAFKSPEFKDSGSYQVIRMGNVRPGKLRLNESPVFIEADEILLKKSLLKLDDLIITQTGTRQKRDYGFTALITKSNLLLNQRITAMRCSDKYSPKFLLYYTWTDEFKNQFFANETGNVGQGNVGMKAITDTIVPFPPISIQQQVVAEIESRLSVCENIEETIINSLLQAESLKQSILKKAFEGKLIKPEMKPVYKPKNTYFYQIQLLGVVAAASKEKGINHGEMTIAKYAYLLDKVYQIPTYYDYKRWHLGPYPPEIKKAINNAKFFTKKNNLIEVKDIDTLTKYINPYTDKLKNAVDDLSDIFAKYTGNERSHQIELLATVCKVMEDIQTTDLKTIRASMAEWKIDLATTHFKSKAEKFNEEETLDCIKLIIGKGWESILIN